MAENVADGPGHDGPSGENEQRDDEEELLARHRKEKKDLQGFVHLLMVFIKSAVQWLTDCTLMFSCS